MNDDFAEACRRVAAARESNAELLDLGDLLLPRLPEELARCVSLRVLSLGRNRPSFPDGKLIRRWDSKRRNQTELSDVSGLASLTQLLALDLSRCKCLSDVSGLASLTQLQTLDLSGCEGLSDVSGLASLTQLQTLDLSGCEGLSDVSELASLTQLQALNLGGCRSLSDVSGLAGLTQLQTLSLSQCGNLSDVSGLASLTQLQTLHLAYCESLKHFGPLVPLLDRLDTLSLHGGQFEDLPVEVCGERSGDTVLESVRAHYRDRSLGEARDAEVKVCILGNVGVGKTQMCRRLNGLPFDRSVPTTHGVQLGHLDLTNHGERVRLNLWDFGGQDIYHGSHALFVQGQAVFVLLWTPDRESGEFTDGGATMQHRPLSYWLDFVRGLAGPDSPVLIVQSQCDEPHQRQNPDLPTHDFRLLRTLSLSAKTDLGLTVLRGELEDAMRDVLNRKPPVPIGAGRVEVRNQLRKMLEEDQQLPLHKRKHRTLSLRKFRNLCKANGKISSPDALLEYLHRAGVLFYRHCLFANEIILDQNWALEAIYTLFDRQRTLPVLNRHGRFTRRELELLVWQKFSVAEQELFLSMMESCGICFRVRNVSGTEWNAEWEYLAPELLSEWSVAQDWLLGRMQGGGDGTRVEVRYRFLHEGILRGFLSRLGRQAGDAALYWKYGCWFFEKSTDSQALIRSEVDPKSGNGTVTLRAVGGRPQQLLETVLKELLSLPIGQPPEVRRSWEEFSETELPGKSRPRKPRRRKTAKDVDDALVLSPKQTEKDGLQSLDVSDRPNLPASSRPAIYVSYAWGDDKSDAGRQREAAVTGLCGMLDRDGYEVLKDDRTLRPGDWISTFMKAIGRGDHVLVILSEKYLLSPYCMTELFYTYSRSLFEKEEFLERIIPVNVGDTGRLNDHQTVLKYVNHWEAEFTGMEPHLPKLGRSQFNHYKLIKRWHGEIGDILGFIADTLHPYDFDAIVKDDFAAVREMLKRIADKP